MRAQACATSLFSACEPHLTCGPWFAPPAVRRERRASMDELALGWATGLATLAAGLGTMVAIHRRRREYERTLFQQQAVESHAPALAVGPITLRGAVRTDDEQA